MKQKVVACWLLMVLAVGYYFLILSYSAAPASKSAAKSNAITRKIVDLYDNVTGRKSTEKVKNVRVNTLHGFIRKCAHVYNFMVLAMILSALFFVATEWNMEKVIYIIVFLIGVFCAAVDEFSQLFVEGRAGQLKDVFIDSIGLCQGILMFFGIKNLFMKEGRML